MPDATTPATPAGEGAEPYVSLVASFVKVDGTDMADDQLRRIADVTVERLTPVLGAVVPAQRAQLGPAGVVAFEVAEDRRELLDAFTGNAWGGELDIDEVGLVRASAAPARS